MSEKHYANAVPDELFDRAAGIAVGAKPRDAKADSVQREAQRPPSATSRNIE